MAEDLAEYYANYAHAPRIDFDDAAMLAVMYAARWATRVQLWPVGGGTTFMVKSALPRDRDEAAALIEQRWRRLFKQIEQHPRLGQFSKVGALLFHAGEVVLDFHDGPGCCLHIAPERFDQLKRCWQDNGMPSDIYLRIPPRTRG